MKRVLKQSGFLYLTVFNFEKKSHIYGDNQDILLEYCVPNHKLQEVEANVSKQACIRR